MKIAAILLLLLVSFGSFSQSNLSGESTHAKNGGLSPVDTAAKTKKPVDSVKKANFDINDPAYKALRAEYEGQAVPAVKTEKHVASGESLTKKVEKKH